MSKWKVPVSYQDGYNAGFKAGCKAKGEACAIAVADLLERDHSYDEVFEITEAIRNAEVKGEK